MYLSHNNINRCISLSSDGNVIEEIINKAEKANSYAKLIGKNKVIRWDASLQDKRYYYMNNDNYMLKSKDRLVRCQGVILKNDSILILEHYNSIRDEKFWLLPGGGMELYESEEEYLHRELKEETNLDVVINQVLFDDIKYGLDYKRYVTFLCTPLADSFEKVGKESNEYKKITKLSWLSINDEDSWSIIQNKEQFYPSLKQIKDKIAKLNYL